MGFSSDMSSEVIKRSSHSLDTLLQLSQTPLGASRSFSSKVEPPASLAAYGQGRDRLQALKSSLIQTNDKTDANALPVSHGPLLDFLQTEWNDLVDTVSSLLSLLQQPVQFATSTFATLPELTDISRLERKAELLSAYLWHQNTVDHPNAFRLSAFKNPKGLLLAVMRQAARANCKYVSDMELCFQVRHENLMLCSNPNNNMLIVVLFPADSGRLHVPNFAPSKRSVSVWPGATRSSMERTASDHRSFRLMADKLNASYQRGSEVQESRH